MTLNTSEAWCTRARKRCSLSRRSARIDAASSMWSWNGSSQSSVGPPPGTALAALMSAAEVSQIFSASAASCRSCCVAKVWRPSKRRSISALRRRTAGPWPGRPPRPRLAQVVGLHEQVPDLLDALGLLDGLPAELLERRDRLAERDQPGRGHRRDRQQHGRQRQPQPPSKRRSGWLVLAHLGLTMHHSGHEPGRS